MPKKSISIQVVSWNVHCRGAQVLDALKGLARPDVLSLQEVRFSQRTPFEKRLRKMGLQCCPESYPNTPGKSYGNLIASRWTIEPVTLRYSREEPPWPELLLEASVSVNGGSFLVIDVHIPNGSYYRWKKIDTFNALKDVVRKAKGRPCIVAGDFNEPQLLPLQDGGRIVTWGQWWDADEGGYVCTGKWKQWDAAVRWMFQNDGEHQMRHAYWEVHAGGMPVSYVTLRGAPRWFDHMFVSPDFRVEQCEYLHDVRLGGHSDHSALEAKLLLKA